MKEWIGRKMRKRDKSHQIGNERVDRKKKMRKRDKSHQIGNERLDRKKNEEKG